VQAQMSFPNTPICISIVNVDTIEGNQPNLLNHLA